MYKIVGTTIKVQITDGHKQLGQLELECQTRIDPESRKVLDDFFHKWKIISIDTTPSEIPVIKTQQISQPQKTIHYRKHELSSNERIEVALDKVPEIFTVLDWMKSFDGSDLTLDDLKAIKQGFQYDISKLLAGNRIIIHNDSTIPFSYKVVETNGMSISEKEEVKQKLRQERKTLVETFK